MHPTPPDSNPPVEPAAPDAPPTAAHDPRRPPHTTPAVPLALVLSGLVAAAVAAGCQPADRGTDPAASAGAGAALDADSLQAILIGGFEAHREMDVAFARAMPDSALRWAPYPDVRDYAEQIEHIVLDNALFTARAIRNEEAPVFGDTAVYLNDREALVGLVEETYDYVLETLRTLPAAELLESTELFGEERAKWRVFLLALQHADWTRGQLVPYLRLNGVEPPSWQAY